MKKKIIRISALVLLLIVILLAALPSLMENKVGELLKANLNNRINGEFDFTSMSLSVYRDFPLLGVSMDSVSLINAEPFIGDTLFQATNIKVALGIKELFKSIDDPIEIREISIENANALLLIDEEGVANYDIFPETGEKDADKSEAASTFVSIRSYEISDSQIMLKDDSSDYVLRIDNLNHKGSGDLSEKISSLQTNTEAVVSFNMEGTKYLEKNSLQLDAELEIDLEDQRYTFKENKAVINRLPLTFEGYIRIIEEGQELDLKFNTVNSDFRNFLAMIPEKYSKDITDLSTKGNFDLAGHFQGDLTDDTIPAFNIRMEAHDASFQYPQFSKKVENIEIDALVENTTGQPEDTSIEIENANFQIDEDVFEMQALLTELTGNTGVRMRAVGSIDLDKLSQVYPLPSSIILGGKLKGDVSSAFTRNDIENEDYKNITLEGILELRGLNYKFDALPNPLKIHTCKAELGPKTIDIEELAGITGSTDFSASGTLRNALGFVFNEEVLKGNFEMKSNAFVVADVVGEEQAGSSATAEEDQFDVPKYLDLNLDALVGKAVYDNIVMYDLSGTLRVKDQTISFTEISSRMLDGRLELDGMLTTKGQEPEFEMSIDLSRLNIGKTFETIELVRLLSPAAKVLDGRLNTKIKLSGGLTPHLAPNFNSLSGDVLAEILTAEIKSENSKVTQLLDDKLNFVSLDDLDLSGLKTAMKFDNGQVKIEPFNLRYKDVDLMFSGGHSFSNALDYQVTINVPASYMGEDVNKLLASIGDDSLKELTVPVVANLRGSVADPKISTDLKSQTKVLADQLVEIQKKKYLDKGKKELSQIIGGVLAGSAENSTDKSTPKSQDGNAVGQSEEASADQTDSIGKLTEKGPEDKDIEKAAKSILGGLLKSKSVTVKDTVN